MTQTPFSSLALNPDMLANLESLGYAHMTPVQAETLPVVLAGQDLIAKAKTGSGKTAAFGIGLLTRLDTQDYHVQALVLCPTRELADQVGKELRRLARMTPNIKLVTLCGGAPYGPQVTSLQHHAHIVVGTPGRILKHLHKGTLKLDTVRMLVLDEADRMLDMGFSDDMTAIIAMTPATRQTLLFSATYPDTIRQMSAEVQREPVEVSVCDDEPHADIQQVFYEFDKGERSKTLKAVLNHYRPTSCLIFCNMKQQCDELATELREQGFYARALHGDLEQKDRDRVLAQFTNKSTAILIATDVAARGLDIKDLDMVINYQLAHDPEIHVHRVGRTGRAGQQGLAISLFMPAEAHKVTAIEDYQGQRVTIQPRSHLVEKKVASLKPPMVTLCLHAGRKDKLRPGDILGALTQDAGLPARQIGNINIFDTVSYIAVERSAARAALQHFSEGKIKGRKFRARKVS
ncbi:MAG: ATP-dependent RNA helicase DbpA [Gammaproteobacteria bacterium]